MYFYKNFSTSFLLFLFQKYLHVCEVFYKKKNKKTISENWVLVTLVLPKKDF